MSVSSNLGILFQPPGVLQTDVVINNAIRILDALVFLSPEEVLDTPPTTDSSDYGKTWICGPAPTGRWAAVPPNAVLVSIGDDSELYVEPKKGWTAYMRDVDAWMLYDGVAWDYTHVRYVEAIVGDQSAAITSGANKYRARIHGTFTALALRASLEVAQATGTALQVDVKKNGVSILSTTLTFDNTETTSKTAATPAVIDDALATFADDDLLSIDVVAVGDGTAKGLKISLMGY